MTAVGMSQEAARNLLQELGLEDRLVVAGINSPRSVTLAGNPIDLERIEARLADSDLFFRRLDLDYAFHSPAMDILEADILSALFNLAPAAGEVPFFSTVTGGRLAGEHLDAVYWWRNIREPVLFSPALQAILQEGTNTFVEIGPHPVLQVYVNECLRDQGMEGRLVRTLARNDAAPERIWRALAQAIISGLPFDWARYYPKPGRRLPLPHYPWQREPLVHPVSPEADGMLHRRWVHPLLGFALPQHTLTWETVLDTRNQPNYADHVVGETVLFPGSGFVELALAAALAWHPADYVEIEGLEIRLPVILSDLKSITLRISLDPQDGRLNIKGREQGSGDAWTLHAVGRIRRESRGLALGLKTPILPLRSPDFTATDHERMTRLLGLNYGPAFKAIDEAWVEDDTVIARLVIPAAIETELADVHLHPSLLDNAFQLLIELLSEGIERREDIGYLPTGMGQIYYRSTPVRPAFAQARLVRRSPHSLVGEFALFGMDGTPIALIREARFRGVMRLLKGGMNPLSFLDFHAVPRPHPLMPQPKPAISYRRVVELLQKSAQECSSVKLNHLSTPYAPCSAPQPFDNWPTLREGWLLTGPRPMTTPPMPIIS
jgi:acyl transferase domain-containing protein